MSREIAGFYDRFAEPIDVPDDQICVVPHLEDSAILNLGGELLVVSPEQDPVVPSMQDYKIISVKGLSFFMQVTGAGDEFVDTVRNIDRLVEAQVELPPGVLSLHHGEEALLGRGTTPQLMLGQYASGAHVNLAALDNGITLNDVGSKNGTSISLSLNDIEKTVELPRFISNQKRDEIFNAYSRLMYEGSFSYNDSDLLVSGGYTNAHDSPFHIIELIFRVADNYRRLELEEGYDFKKFDIDPTELGIKICDISGDKSDKGVRKANKRSQLTGDQAEELLQIARQISDKTY